MKLCDFRLAKAHDFNSESHTARKGTPGYMAPEIMSFSSSKNHYTPKADVYSLGRIAQTLFDLDINS